MNPNCFNLECRGVCNIWGYDPTIECVDSEGNCGIQWEHCDTPEDCYNQCDCYEEDKV